MSTRITFGMTTQTVLTDIENVYSQLTKTQDELSSGKKINTPSDDPFGTSQALQDSTALAANQQYQTNVTSASSWLSSTDTALSSMVNDFQRARELVVQGANGTMSQGDRNAIVSELDQLADSIKTAANTTNGGTYIFSGTATSTPPYAVGGNFVPPPGTSTYNDAYAGNAGAINRSIGQNVTLQVNTPGSPLVDQLLSAIRQAQTDLSAGGTPANLNTTDLQAFDTAANQLSQTQAVVGASETRLTTASSRLQQLQTAISQQLSDAQDADMAQTMIDFSNQSAVYQAALKVGASLVQPSLLNYLS